MREHISDEETLVSPGKLTAGDGSVEEALYALDGYLVASGTYGVLFHQASYLLSEFETQPPVDKISWRTYQEQLNSSLTDGHDPHDLAGWLNDFPGETLAISGGQISSLRATEYAFRFVLDLSPGFQVTGSGGPDFKRFRARKIHGSIVPYGLAGRIWHAFLCGLPFFQQLSI